MTKRAKMCKWHKPYKKPLFGITYGCHKNWKLIPLCPKNTNARCEITTPKRKVKKLYNMGTGQEYMQIKAHCSGRALDCITNGIPCFVGPRLHKTDVPVTILIDKKFLREGKC